MVIINFRLVSKSKNHVFYENTNIWEESISIKQITRKYLILLCIMSNYIKQSYEMECAKYQKTNITIPCQTSAINNMKQTRCPVRQNSTLLNTYHHIYNQTRDINFISIWIMIPSQFAIPC